METVLITHSLSTLTLKFTSSLDEVPANEVKFNHILYFPLISHGESETY